MSYRTILTDLTPDCDPRHVEAYMRLELGTLDHLEPAEFRKQARLAAAAVRNDRAAAENLARSFGL